MNKVRKKNSQCCRCFTLVEMLVVITIVSILASLLLPLLGSAQEMARGVRCTNNLRGFGTASAQYMSNYNGWMVWLAQGATVGECWIMNQAFYSLFEIRFAKNNDTGWLPAWSEEILCPGMENPLPKVPGLRIPEYSYGLNGYGASWCGDGADPGTWVLPRSTQISRVKSPSRRFLFREALMINIAQEIPVTYIDRYGANGWFANGNRPDWGTVPYRHSQNNGCSLLFVDGHVEMKTSDDLVLNLQARYRRLYE